MAAYALEAAKKLAQSEECRKNSQEPNSFLQLKLKRKGGTSSGGNVAALAASAGVAAMYADDSEKSNGISVLVFPNSESQFCNLTIK